MYALNRAHSRAINLRCAKVSQTDSFILFANLVALLEYYLCIQLNNFEAFQWLSNQLKFSGSVLLDYCRRVFNEAFVLLFGNFWMPTSLRFASVVTWSASWMLMQDIICISVMQDDFEAIWYSQSQPVSLKICRFGPISVSVRWVSKSSVWTTGWTNGKFGFDSRQSKHCFF